MHLVIKNLQGEVILEPEILNKDFRFSNILGSGQSGLNLEIKYSGFDLIGMFIEFHIGDKLAYSGIIYNEKLNFSGITEIQTIGLFDLFNRKETSVNYGDATGNINYLINWINANYGAYRFILEAPKSKSYTRSGVAKGGAIIKDIVSKTGWDFYLGADRKVKFGEKISNKIYKLSFGEKGDIIKGYLGQKLNNLCNYSRVHSDNYDNYNRDQNSIDKFGRTEKYVNQNGMGLGEVVEKTNLNLKPNPDKQTRVELNRLDLDILPGDYITIINSPVEIKEVKIVKVDYSLNKTIIYLDVFSNIYKELKD